MMDITSERIKQLVMYYATAEKLEQLYVEHKITQDELAGAVGVTRQTIISLENGKYNASLQLAYRIARYFNRYIEDVFVFEEEA